MSSRPKIAFHWCSSCGGCEESVIDLAEDILLLERQAEIVFWPIAIDRKFADLEAMGDGEILVAFINGAVRTDEQEAAARLLRRKSRIVAAHGSCAHLGGVVGLANFFTREEVISRAYEEAATVNNPEGIRPQILSGEPGRELDLPRFHEEVKALDQVVEVDFYIPGCPPTPELLDRALKAALEDRLPPKGSVLGERRALCHTCPRGESRDETVRIERFKRLYECEWNAEECFLNQGLICLGPATRGGCGARCVNGNMPCRGCFGPAENVRDQGAKSLAFLAAMFEAKEAEELEKAASSIPDPGGLFYRYSLAVSLLRGKRIRGPRIEDE